MLVNGYRGEVAIRIGGKDRVLRFGWSGIALLQQELGQDFDVKISQAMTNLDLAALAKVLAIGLRDSWPDVTAEMIVQESPPIAMVNEKIMLGLKRAFHGEAPAEPDENPRKGRLQTALQRIGLLRV